MGDEPNASPSEDYIAGEYDRLAEGIFESETMYADSIKLAPDCRGRVLDVGCGQGILLAHLERRFDAIAELAGCDISPRLCELARQRVPRARIAVANAQRLEGVPDAHFDFAFMIAILEHTLDHEATMRACYRVLRPGGILIVVVPNRCWLRYETWLRHHTQTEPVDPHWFTPRQVSDLAQRTGFTVERMRGVWALVWGDWRHHLETAAAVVVPGLHRRMKMIGVRCRKPEFAGGPPPSVG